MCISTRSHWHYIYIALAVIIHYTETERYKVLQQAMTKGLQVPLKFLKFVFFGPPGAGKTTFMRRLIGEIKSIIPDCVQPSTLTADQKELMIKVCLDKESYSNETLVINRLSLTESDNVKSEWCSVSKEKGKCNLDEEAMMIYNFINDLPNKESVDYSLETAKPSQPPPEHSNAHQESSSLDNSTNMEESSQSIEIQHLRESDSNQTIESSGRDNIPQYTERNRRTGIATQLKHIPKDHLTPNFLGDYKQIIDMWQRCFAKKDYGQIIEVLSKSVMVNVMDVGGQPPFLEMVPALAHGPGLYLICFNLQNEINKRHEVAYITGDCIRHELQYSYSVLEVLFHCLSSIICFSAKRSDVPEHLRKLMPPPLSKAAMIIGTHKDKFKGNEIKIERMDEKIQRELSKLVEYDCMDERYYHKYLSMNNDKVLTAVDNTLGEDEIKHHRNRIEKIINQLYGESEFQIPASWLMFSLILRKLERNVLSIKECQYIANDLGIQKEDVKHILSFLHYDIGIIMYYSSDEVKNLDEDVIICQPQLLFKSIGDLVLNAFLPEQCDRKQTRENFWKKGQFKQVDIERCSANATKDNSVNTDQLSLEQLIGILQHLNVLVPLDSEVFFMPAVMKAAPEKVRNKYKHFNVIAPLLIRFKCVFVPIGCFTAMIARLVCYQDKNKWQLSIGDALYKDMVTFLLPGNYKAILMCHPKRFEIHLSSIPNRFYDDHVKRIASNALETICSALDEVLRKLKEQYTSESCNLTIYDIGFFCCCKGFVGIPDYDQLQQQHLMLINNKSIFGKLATCTRDRSGIRLEPAHLVWNGSHDIGGKLATRDNYWNG